MFGFSHHAVFCKVVNCDKLAMSARGGKELCQQHLTEWNEIKYKNEKQGEWMYIASGDKK